MQEEKKLLIRYTILGGLMSQFTEDVSLQLYKNVREKYSGGVLGSDFTLPFAATQVEIERLSTRKPPQLCV